MKHLIKPKVFYPHINMKLVSHNAFQKKVTFILFMTCLTQFKHGHTADCMWPLDVVCPSVVQSTLKETKLIATQWSPLTNNRCKKWIRKKKHVHCMSVRLQWAHSINLVFFFL